MLSIPCTNCKNRLTLTEAMFGKKVRCQSCNLIFVVDRPAAPPTPAAAPPEVVDGILLDEEPPAATAIRIEVKPVPKKAPPMVTAAKEDKRPTRSRSAKPNAKAAAGGRGGMLLLLGVGAFAFLSLTCCVGAGGFWWYSRDGGKAVAQNPKDGILAEKDKKVDGNPKNDDGVPKIDDGKIIDVPKVVPVDIKPPKLDQEKIVRDLPANADQLVVGGGGRFILFNLPQTRKIALFDANEAKITHYFSVSGDNVRFAASMDKLVMVFPDTKIVQRWSLLTKDREVTSTLDVTTITSVAMGSASNGPLLVAGGDRFGGGGADAFIDLKTLKSIAIQREGNGGGRGFSEAGGGLRVSADGTVFGCWGSGSPTGLQTYVLTGNRLKGHYEHTTVGHISPGPDGKYVYTGGGLYTSEVKPVGANTNRNGNGKFTVPALQGNYYLTISSGDRFDPFNKNQPASLTVHQAGEDRALITLNNIEMAEVGDRWAPDPVGRDKRYLLIPDAKMLVVFPQTNNRIVIHRFDVEEAMEKAGIDYLFVTSRPPLTGQRGQSITYAIKVKAKQGGVKFKLDAGPQGMKLASDGTLTWKIPAAGAEGEHNIIVTISDKSGQEIFHTFKIAVGDVQAKVDPPPFVPPLEPPFPKEKIDFPPKEPFEKKEPDPPVVVKGELPPLPPRLLIQPPKLEQDKVTRALPDSISDVTIGGGGRFLICLLPKTRQLAIFDANEGKVVKFLPVTGDNVRVTAGMTKLFVAFPDTKIVQRWSLVTFERELSTTLPLNDKLAGIGMGYGSDGPLFVQTTRGIVSGEQLFFDAKTMKRLDLTRNQMGGHVHIGDNARVRASADGRVLGITAEHDGGHIIVIDNAGKFTPRNMENAGYIPGPDGKTIFGNGLSNQQGQNLAKHANMHCVPALQGNFFLGIPSGSFHPSIPDDKSKFGNVALYITGDTRPLVTLPDVEKALRDVFSGNREALRIDQRYHFIPDAQLLVTIPSTADKLIVQKLDLDAALDKAGIDYLFVHSAPFPYAVKGQEFRYQVNVKSKKGVARHKVDAGPTGMKASASGLVTWQVPKDFADSTVDVILSIGDKADQEIFHIFKLAVVAELPAGVSKDPAPIAPPKEAKKIDVKDEREPIVKLPPMKPDAGAIKAPTLSEPRVTRELPDTISDVAVGGGGRFLLLNLPGTRKIALFDVNEAKITHYFPVSGDNVRFAAGMDKLVMVFPSTKIIQRWNLLTQERELTATLENSSISNVVMGSASHGPILVAGGSRFDGGSGKSEFLDLKSLKPITTTTDGRLDRGFGANVRASADGTVFGIWETGISPSGLQTAILDGGKLKGFYEHTSVGHILPGPDGKVLFTGGGLYTNEVKPIGNNTRNGNGRFCLPAAHGNFYLRIDFGKFSAKPTEPKVDVHFGDDARPLASLGKLDLGTLDRFGRDQTIAMDKRIHFIPDAKVIVTLPTTNKSLVIQRFDVDEAMDKAGIDYLLVTSRPPHEVRPGAELLYPIQVKSKKGGVTYRLDAGPADMKLTKAGVLVWRVPADQAAGDVSVIATVSDQSGQEIFHTFRIRVVAAD